MDRSSRARHGTRRRSRANTWTPAARPCGLDPGFDRWLRGQRQRAAAIARAAAADLVGGAAGPEAALNAATLLATADPCDESACRTLMTLHAEQGDGAAAERAFTRCRAALLASAGAAPGAETQALFVHVRASGRAATCVANRLGDSHRSHASPHTPDGSREDPLSLGLAEEITTALSQFRGMSCIASSSLARLAGRGRNLDSVFEKVELDFLLDGTIRRSGTRVRIDVQLLDVSARSEVVWERRFERDSTDLFTLQDEIAAEIAAQVDPALMLREASRAGVRPSTDASAHELTLRAIPAVYRLDRAGYRAAGSLLEAAIAADPSHSAAYAWLAYWHLFLVGQGWADEPASSIMLAEALAEKAVALDPGDARALTLAGHVRAFLHRRVDEAIALHERALSLNPNLAAAWVFSSLAYTYAGSPEEGLQRARHAKRLAPLDPHGFMADAAIMMPLLTQRDFAAVVETGRVATGIAPGFSANWKLYASALGHLSQPQQAAQAIEELLRLEPELTVQNAFDRSPLLRPEDRSLYADGLRRAGLPDGGLPLPL